LAQRIEISHKTIIFTTFFLISLWIVYQVRDVIFLFLVSIVVMAGMRPAVDRLEKIKIPRAIAILIVYIVFFITIGFSFFLIIPPLLSQSQELFESIGVYFSFVLPFVDLSPERITDQIPVLSQNVLKVTTGIFSTILGLFTFLVFTFYFLLERRHLRQFLNNFVGAKAERKITDIFRKVEVRLSNWIAGQLALMLIIGLATYIGLMLLGVKFALPLAIIAGILEIVPILGPLISSVPSVIIALSVSPILALAVAALYFIIQQIENNIVVPLVMRRAVGLPPLITITAIIIGGKLAGVSGIIISIPLVVAAQVVVRELFLQYEIKT
jgi:predicted PurR-regulated permease PerM